MIKPKAFIINIIRICVCILVDRYNFKTYHVVVKIHLDINNLRIDFVEKAVIALNTPGAPLASAEN